MLEITIPGGEFFDESTNKFISIEETTLQLEHSLVSLAAWEAKWCKVFLTRTPKTNEETLDYIRCMTLTPNVDPNVYYFLTEENVKQINEYIEAPMTAVQTKDMKGGGRSGEPVMAELMYYWMTALNMPFECDHWHLNRFLAFVRVCNIKSQPPTKMGRKALMARNTSLNAARRQALNSKG